MNETTFFISKGENHSSLNEVAMRVFKAFRIDEWEERNSSNYPPDEHYFAGYLKNAEVTVFDDDTDHAMSTKYPFGILVEDPSWRIGSGTIERDPTKIARLLVLSGFSVFIPDGDWSRKDWDGHGEVYTSNNESI